MNNKFDRILTDFEPLSEIEKMDKVNGGKRLPIVAAYAIIVTPVIKILKKIFGS